MRTLTRIILLYIIVVPREEKGHSEPDLWQSQASGFKMLLGRFLSIKFPQQHITKPFSYRQSAEPSLQSLSTIKKQSDIDALWTEAWRKSEKLFAWENTVVWAQSPRFCWMQFLWEGLAPPCKRGNANIRKRWRERGRTSGMAMLPTTFDYMLFIGHTF